MDVAGSTAFRTGLAAARVAGLVLACALLGGCAELLPKARTEVANPWHSYEQAREAVERIVPYQTTTADLKARGIDPYVTPNVQLLNYSEIVLRFPLSGSMPWERLDRGLRECLEAGKACEGYSITALETRRDRIGNFWLDALQFHRTIDVSGWSFNALILVVDSRVVYVLHGGRPLIKEQEINKQPLGIFQGWGDSLPGLFK